MDTVKAQIWLFRIFIGIIITTVTVLAIIFTFKWVKGIFKR